MYFSHYCVYVFLLAMNPQGRFYDCTEAADEEARRHLCERVCLDVFRKIATSPHYIVPEERVLTNLFQISFPDYWRIYAPDPHYLFA